jgi:ABC-type Mn2+/Zn2+ transport system ATPase subunit
MKNFNGYWDKNNLDLPSLVDINIHFKKGLFYGICGKVASGKSGLVGAILNEIPYYSGLFAKNGSISYVEQ